MSGSRSEPIDPLCHKTLFKKRKAPMDRDPHILILEDAATDAELIERELRKANVAFTSQRVETKEGFSKALLEFEPDIVLSDYNLPQFSGLEALHLLKEKEIPVPFILITGTLTDRKSVV